MIEIFSNMNWNEVMTIASGVFIGGVAVLIAYGLFLLFLALLAEWKS